MSNNITYDLTDKMGRGIFAKKDIRKGSIIEISPAIILSPGDDHFVQNTILSYYTFQCDDNIAMSAVALGYGSLFNHSDDPNADFVALSEEKVVKFTANKDIKKGEQIFIHYGWEDEFEDVLTEENANQ